ncbi:YfcC family protein [Olsenella massiliensis]|uniref:YfcC family protein n=1 Tax=Olsenella massiliensis TaxID=1622075 RepID=UPI00071C218E|nr:YfcC family protein [Olsenella massiliensis]
MTEEAQPKKKRGMISSFSIIFILLAIVAVITICLNGQTYMLDGVEKTVTGATLGDFLMAPARGFVDAVDVCLFVIVLGGFLGIVNKTNALNTGIKALVKKMGGNELVLIPILMILFAVLGSTYGFCEETVGFYALLAATMMAAGYDALTGAMMILLGAGVGCLGSTVNPFATGIASSALTSLGIEVNQAVIIGLGIVLLIATYLVAVFFTIQYAKRVKADPSRTLMSAGELEAANAEYGIKHEEGSDVALTGRQKGVLVIFALAFLVMIIGFVPWEDLGVNAFVSDAASHEETIEVTAADIIDQYDGDSLGALELPETTAGTLTSDVTDNAGWSSFLTGTPLGQWYFAESTTWFLLLAIIIGIVGGLSEKEIVDEFMAGSGDMMSVVLIIAVSRGVSVLMSSTGLSNFFLTWAAGALAGTSGVLFTIGSYVLYFFLSFLIPSTSGMATVSMPIMGPLAQELGFNPAVMVMIFSAASGAVNLITPTSGAIMGGLALARVEYGTWVKFAAKIVGCVAVVSMVILAIAMMAIPA